MGGGLLSQHLESSSLLFPGVPNVPPSMRSWALGEREVTKLTRVNSLIFSFTKSPLKLSLYTLISKTVESNCLVGV